MMRTNLPWRGARKSVILAVALTLAAPMARGQATPTDLRVAVRPTVELLPGSTVRMTYQVEALAPGRDSLFGFTVEAPAVPIRIARPAPAEAWLALSRFGTASVASWTALDLVAPGQSTPGLTFDAVGLPDIVRYSVLRSALPSDDVSDYPDDAPSRTTTGPQIFEPGNPDRVVGSTVGVAAIPDDASPSALGSRLAALVDRACALDWVDNQGVCTSLRAKAVPSAGPLGALLEELDAQRGHHVTEAGYALLRANAVYLLGRL